jgi:tetratricopeptide (TPR) repeat protein
MSAPSNLDRLGLADGATDDEIEQAHDELVAYLQLAPAPLRDWAAAELAAAEEAYTELLAHEPLTPESAAPVEPVAAPPSNGHATLKLRSRVASFDELGDGGDLFDGHLPPPGRPADAKLRAKAARATKPAVAAAAPAARLSPKLRRAGLAVGGLAVVAVLAFAVYQFGLPAVPAINGTPAPSASDSGPDPAEITALMQRITANPQDTDALQQLADDYYAAGDYQTTQIWLDKLLAIDPQDVAALLGQGAVAYNTGDYATAEQSWRTVLTIDDQNVEAHYDLGFMYFTMDPPQDDLARAEWQRVIDLAPNSDIAQKVQAHLSLLDPQASGSPAPSAAPTTTPAAAN